MTAALVIGVVAWAGDGIPVERISTWGGWVSKVLIRDDLAYVATGQQIKVLDVTTPSKPMELGSVGLSGVVFDMHRTGDLLLVAALLDHCPGGELIGGFVIVDISNPLAPRLRSTNSSGRCDSLNVYYSAIAIDDDIAYAFDRSKLEIWDISDPFHPEYLRNLGALSFSMVFDLELFKSRDRQRDLLMIVSAQDEEVSIMDVTEPLDPILVGVFELPAGADTPFGGDVSGDYIFVAAGESGLLVLDIVDPAAITQIADLGDLGWAHAVRIADQTAFVGVGNNDRGQTPGALVTIDVGDPENPQVLSRVEFQGAVTRITLAGDLAYVGDQGEGVRVFDVSNPADPTQIGSFYSPGKMTGLAKSGDVLYVADQYYGLTALDVSDPLCPSLLGRYRTGPWSFRLTIRGDLAFLAAGHSGLDILDVSDPSSISLVGRYPVGTGTSCVDVSGDVAVVGREFGIEVSVIDVADPASPDLVTTVPLDFGRVYDVVIRDSLAYIGRDVALGYVVLDISDPPNTTIAYQNKRQPPVGVDLELAGDLLLGASSSFNWDQGLYILDNSDPFNPELLGFASVRSAYAVAVDDGLAYVTASSQGVVVFDITDPANPVELQRSDIGGSAQHVLVEDGYCYVTEQFGGLSIYRLDGGCSADLDRDGQVGVSDLLVLLVSWGDCGQGDLDQSGAVDFADLLIVLAAWGPCE